MFLFITIFCLILAGICNAIMDTIVHHWSTSIFSKIKNPKTRFWFGEIDGGSVNKYINRDPSQGRIQIYIFGCSFNKPVQMCDAWHFFKMLMIIFYAIPATIAIYNSVYDCCLVFRQFDIWIKILFYFWWLLIVGVIINESFNLFYNHILKK